MPALPFIPGGVTQVGFTVGGVLLMLAGVLLLRRRWSGAAKAGQMDVPAGWLLALAGGAALIGGWGVEPGIAYGLIALSLAGYLVVFAGAQYRVARQREARAPSLAPQGRQTDWLRGTAKAFLAIILSGVAALGLGVAFALATPFDIHDRIVLGGLLVPVLWGAGMAWTLCDAKLLRAAMVLLAVSAFGYGVAFLPRLFS